jgi:hypothetical protein
MWREDRHPRGRAGRFADVAGAGTVTAQRRGPLAGAAAAGWDELDPLDADNLPMPWDWQGGAPPRNPRDRRDMERTYRRAVTGLLVRGDRAVVGLHPRINRLHLHTAAHAVDELDEFHRSPHRPVAVGIGTVVNPRGRRLDALTAPGTARIRLSEDLFTEPDYRPGLQQAYAQELALEAARLQPGMTARHRPRQRYLPGMLAAPLPAYVLSHEWGHVINTAPRQALIQMRRNHGWLGLTDRAHREDPAEAYADAFAEWHLSGGRSDNPAVRAYAARFRWSTPT